MTMKRTIQTILTGFALFAIVQTTAIAQTPDFAQKQYKISIEKGTVFIDGKKVATEDLPKSLMDLNDKTMVQFWGDESAIMELNGVAYMISGGKLIEAPESVLEEGTLNVFFSSRESIPFRLIERRSAPTNVVVSGYFEALNERAAEVENIRLKIESGAVPEQALLARQLSVEAENAVRLARSFPVLQFESYLDDIQDDNRFLYDELVRENEMEMQTHHLAMLVRDAETRSDQEKLTAELRSALEKIFQLKQENRRVEIEQLSLRLTELKERLKERESLRDEIVENRIRELLEQYRWNP